MPVNGRFNVAHFGAHFGALFHSSFFQSCVFLQTFFGANQHFLSNNVRMNEEKLAANQKSRKRQK